MLLDQNFILGKENFDLKCAEKYNIDFRHSLVCADHVHSNVSDEKFQNCHLTLPWLPCMKSIAS